MFYIPIKRLRIKKIFVRPLTVDLLYSCFGEALHTAADEILHSDALADDAVAETFARFIAKGYACEPPERAAALLMKICKNVATDMKKAQNRAELVEDADRFIDVTADVEQIAAENETRREVAAVVAALPNELIEVYRLKYILRKTDAETAEALGISVSAVKKRHTRLKNAVRKEMEGRL